MNLDLDRLVRTSLGTFDPEPLEPFFGALRAVVGERAVAIVAYGSCLSDVTRSRTSTPDFYVIVERYGDFHASRLHAWLNSILPPSIYHFRAQGRSAKFNVIRMADLLRETSPAGHDVYQMGRFSKRVALLWARDEETREAVVRAHAGAMESVARKVLLLMPETFTIDEFATEALRISYTGDVRVEADDKIDRLYRAEREFYRKGYGSILNDFPLSPLENGYRKSPLSVRDRIGRLCVRFFLARSRLRAQLRWPKGIFTVDNWLDYLLEKIERTQGIRIEMTPKEKRLWFVYGWRHFLRLRREKRLQ